MCDQPGCPTPGAPPILQLPVAEFAEAISRYAARRVLNGERDERWAVQVVTLAAQLYARAHPELTDEDIQAAMAGLSARSN